MTFLNIIACFYWLLIKKYLYYSLTKICKLAVGNFTEVQAERIELNPIISSACQHVMEHHCEVHTNFFFIWSKDAF